LQRRRKEISATQDSGARRTECWEPLCGGVKPTAEKLVRELGLNLGVYRVIGKSPFKLRGLKRVDWFYRLVVTAYNLMRLGKLIPIPVQVGSECPNIVRDPG
jgi:hypothetical protein